MDSYRPLVSVIVPIYNAGQYINKCLQSIISQTYENIEIILVDDGSTDGGGELCDKWAKQEGRIRVCHKQNGGLVSARKKGVETARGKYVAHVDADDWIEPEMYEEMVKRAVECDADVVTSGMIRDYANHSVVEHEGLDGGIYRGGRLEKEYWTNVIATDTFFKSNTNMHITNKLSKREIALKHQMGLPDSVRLFEDAAVVYPMVFDARCIVVTGKAFYHYVIHDNSMMSQSRQDAGIAHVRKIFGELVGKKEKAVPNIRQQLDRALLYAMLFAEPEQVFRTNGHVLYPYEGLGQGIRVIVYGTGRFGREVFDYLHKTRECEVVAWCDKVTKDGIVSLEEALKYEFDKIIIAVLLSDMADSIEAVMLDKGIEKERICRIRKI